VEEREQATEEIQAILEEVASRRRTITYSEVGRELGRDTSDKLAFHSTELRRVHDAFAR
jgi:hypothetical protein